MVESQARGEICARLQYIELNFMFLQYNDALMEHLDVIILGGYWGGGRRGGVISQFLLGVAVSPIVPGTQQ